jgi:RNA polymerase sigma-70 factor (ECF subfamily)
LVATLEQVFREEWGRVLASLIGILGDFDLAEEAAQEAFAIPPITGHATACRPTRAPG